MRAIRLYLVLFAISALAVLSACGGGSGTTTTTPPSAPVFSSTPSTGASQGVAYSYQLSATDSAGGAVTFALTTAPTGATLNSGTVTWTPSAAQSRVSNEFTVTATAASGGTATQSWTVTPAGTVTVSMVTTYWTSDGSQSTANDYARMAAAIPNADGSLTIIAATSIGGGVYNIPSVPGGYYWLVSALSDTSILNAYWTSSSTIDLGTDIPGLPNDGPGQQNTAFNYSIAGLAPTSPASIVNAATDLLGAPSFELDPAADATSVSATEVDNNYNDWSTAENLFLGQYEPLTLDQMNELTLGPALTVSNPGFVNGATNNVSGALQASPQFPMNITVPGSQWAQMFSAIGPSTAQSNGSWLSVTAEPFMSGRNQSPQYSYFFSPPDVSLVAPPAYTSSNTSGPSPDYCLMGSRFSGVFGTIPTQGPGILTTENLALNYGDPYPASWTRALAFCQVESIFPAGGGIVSQLPFGMAIPPSSSPSLAPLALPVVSPTINSSSLFTGSTLDTTVVTLSWSAPQGAAPIGYMVTGWSETPVQNGFEIEEIGQFGTAKTSITLPPLIANQTYFFYITTLVDAAANMETSPFRSALPTGFANVVSAPITISAGATMPAIHGDAQLFEKLMSRRVKMNSSPFVVGERHNR